MQASGMIGLSLLALSASSSPDTWVGASDSDPLHVGGSAANTTSAFDGTYTGVAIKNNSKRNTLATAGFGTVKCQNYDRPPTLTVTNGLAQFEVLGVKFTGDVTPQGHLKMHSGYGATLAGQIIAGPTDEDFDGQFDGQ